MATRPRNGPPSKAAPQNVKKGGRIIDWYDVGRKLHASTATGTELFAALHKPTGELVLIKAVERARLGRNYAQPVQLYSKLQHPHICQQLEVFDSTHFVMVCELIDGMTLKDFMLSNGLVASESQQVLHQLCAALAYMHSEGVCHRDISLDNVMLAVGPKCNVKLIDFSCCGPTARALTRKMPSSSVNFAAPELFGEPIEYHGAQVDIWALGIITHVMITGKFPFTNEQEIRAAKLQLPETIDPEVAKLIKSMLSADPAARPTAEAVLKHPWIARGGETSGGSVTSRNWSEPEVVEDVLAECSAMGLDPTQVTADVKEKAHTDLSTSYFLLAQRMERVSLESQMPSMPEGEDAAGEAVVDGTADAVKSDGVVCPSA